MKTQTNRYERNDNVSVLLHEVIGKKADKAVKILEKHRIITIGQFLGALISGVPEMTEKRRRQRQMVCSIAAFNKSKSAAHAIRKISQTLGLNKKEAILVFKSLQNVKNKCQSYKINFNWAFGTKKTIKPQRKSSFWVKLRPQKKKSTGFHVIPSYHEMGLVFDQGNRGTCVSNATISLIDYLSNSAYSREFLYCQCKSVDGIKEQDGTYIETPFEILQDGKYLDHGCVEEKIWPYDPLERDTVHHGPPPDSSYDCQRIIATETIFPRLGNILEDIIDLLNRGLPTVIGVPLFESFLGYETHLTGWVTMPLKGEIIYGYHAMLIVGYDVDRRLFLVRNSWSVSWASQNEKGYPGHALIPYEYIQNYCFSAATVGGVYNKHVTVNHADRLYFRSTIISNLRKKAAVNMKKHAASQGLKKRKKAVRTVSRLRLRKSIKRRSFVSRIFKLAVMIVLIIVFKEPLLAFLEESYEIVSEKIPFNELRERVYAMIDAVYSKTN